MDSDFERGGQSLVEVLVAIGVGTIMVVAATSALVPALTINKQLAPIQTGTTLAVQLLDNVRTWSEGNWNNILSLATGTANVYYLNTANSPFTATTGTESIVTSVNPPGLVGWWPLNEGTGTIAYDASGNNATGSWNGTQAGSSTYYSPGNVSSWAGYFNGSNDYVNIGSPSSLDLMGSTTVSVWAKSGSAAGTELLAGNWILGSSLNYGLFWNDSGGLGGIGFVCSSAVAELTTNPYTDNKWHLITGICTSGSSFTAQLYVDGTLVKTATGGSSISNPTRAWQIGAGTGQWYFSGSIDDVRIYNTALTAAQISQIYNAQKYTRSFYLSDVYRSGGDIVTSGGTYDPSTKMVTVQYQIPPGVTSTISTYITRHGENIFDQTDWSGGGGLGTPVTVPGSVFASSSNIDYTTTTGSFYLAIPGY